MVQRKLLPSNNMEERLGWGCMASRPGLLSLAPAHTQPQLPCCYLSRPPGALLTPAVPPAPPLPGWVTPVSPLQDQVQWLVHETQPKGTPTSSVPLGHVTSLSCPPALSSWRDPSLRLLCFLPSAGLYQDVPHAPKPGQPHPSPLLLVQPALHRRCHGSREWLSSCRRILRHGQ